MTDEDIEDFWNSEWPRSGDLGLATSLGIGIRSWVSAGRPAEFGMIDCIPHSTLHHACHPAYVIPDTKLTYLYA